MCRGLMQAGVTELDVRLQKIVRFAKKALVEDDLPMLLGEAELDLLKVAAHMCERIQCVQYSLICQGLVSASTH